MKLKAPADLAAPAEQDPCAGAGLCWSAPDGPVKVRDLTTVGDGGEAGIYIGDTDDADAKVAHNTSTGWTFGFFFRDSRVGAAWGNNLARNCIGALILDTGPNGGGTGTETREEFTNHPAGVWLLVGNRIVRNTRFCPAEGEGAEGAPPVGGHGVAVIGADHVRILHNTIRGNNPPAEGESALPSSGVTIADGTKLVARTPPGTSWWPGTVSATSWTCSGTSRAAGSGSGTTGAGPRPRTASATDPVRTRSGGRTLPRSSRRRVSG